MYWCNIPPVWRFDETPKQRYKREQSWKRWERRYGSAKRIMTGYLGTYEGVRIITSKARDASAE